MKKILILLMLIGLKNVVLAQDPHFSQFFSSPLITNPANTGKFDGTVRVAGNYRNQWPTINNAFITETGSVDFHIAERKIPEFDTWGVGFMALNDNSANGAVNFNYFGVSTAYHKGLDENGMHQLGVGLQATYANMVISTDKLTFEDQLTTLGFTGTTQESFNNAQLQSHYVDVNAGVLYSGSTSDKNSFYLGVSLYHFNRPAQHFTNTTYTLNPRGTIHAGGFFPTGESTILHLSGLQSFQAGASETLLGGAMQFVANPQDEKPTSVYVGSWTRLGDAILPYVGLEFGDLRIGASYDINTSSLKTASQKQGGIEISMIYAFRPSTDKPVKCPKF